jgi:hypothetical protein
MLMAVHSRGMIVLGIAVLAMAALTNRLVYAIVAASIWLVLGSVHTSHGLHES